MLYWLLNLPHTNTKINDVYVPGFIVAVLGFGCQGPLQSRMCLRDQDPLKAWDFKPLVWTPLGRHSTRLPVVRCWKRALSLLWPLTTSQTPMRDLSGLHCCKSFSCCFCSIFFAVINHSGAYYVLLNPESPSWWITKWNMPCFPFSLHPHFANLSISCFLQEESIHN